MNLEVVRSEAGGSGARDWREALACGTGKTRKSSPVLEFNAHTRVYHSN